MSLSDEAIRLSGRVVTIVRSGANVTTFMAAAELGNIVGKRKPDPFYDYEVGMMFPSDSTIVEGDLILENSNYYLAMSVAETYLGSDLQYYRGMLYRCNSVVSIYGYDSNTKKPDNLIKANVQCLITQVRAQNQEEDKALTVKNYRGKNKPFQIFMRDTEGLLNTSVIIDQGNRNFRVNKQFDVFVASGIVQTQMILE